MISYYAGIFTLVIGIFIIIAFVFLLSNRFPVQNAVKVSTSIYSFRKKYFYLLLFAVIISSYYALSYTPYNRYNNDNDNVISITVIGQKWLWRLGNGVYSQKFLKSSDNDKIIIPKNKIINFYVSSDDVNHGLGIYNSNSLLLGQVQAMPGHIHVLSMKFKQSGVYKILCMEYCGVGHHVMQESFVVK